MAILKHNTKLSEIVLNEPSSIAILNRFGIFLGFGDKTVADICDEKDLDVSFFTTILNTYINEDYFPLETLKSYSAGKLIEYFTKTNNYYQRFQIPNIERHFDLLLSKSDSANNNLGLLRNFFSEVKNELINRIDNDTKNLFPKVQNAENAKEYISTCENDLIEDKLNDLINMFVLHLKGEYDVNLCHAVLIAILSLQKDIRQNNRIRYRIFMPLIS